MQKDAHVETDTERDRHRRTNGDRDSVGDRCAKICRDKEIPGPEQGGAAAERLFKPKVWKKRAGPRRGLPPSSEEFFPRFGHWHVFSKFGIARRTCSDILQEMQSKGQGSNSE